MTDATAFRVERRIPFMPLPEYLAEMTGKRVSRAVEVQVIDKFPAAASSPMSAEGSGGAAGTSVAPPFPRISEGWWAFNAAIAVTVTVIFETFCITALAEAITTGQTNRAVLFSYPTFAAAAALIAGLLHSIQD